MDHEKLAPKAYQLSLLIRDNAFSELSQSKERITKFLDGDEQLQQYLRDNNKFHENDLSNWKNCSHPLSMAAFHGRPDLLRLLLVKYKVQVDLREIGDGRSMTALHNAIYRNQEECVKALLERQASYQQGGMDWNGRNKFKDALGYAVMKGRGEIKKIFEEHIRGKLRHKQ